MMGGRAVDQRWYWDGKTFVTDLKGVADAALGGRGQDGGGQCGRRRTGRRWKCPHLCQAKSRVVPIEGGGPPVGAGAFARKAGDLANFRASPEFDGATLALAAR